jgi:hypothetical protein
MRSNPLPGRVQQQNSDEAKRLCAIAEVWIPGINTCPRTILNASLSYLTELIGIIGPSLCLVKSFSGEIDFFLIPTSVIGISYSLLTAWVMWAIINENQTDKRRPGTCCMAPCTLTPAPVVPTGVVVAHVNPEFSCMCDGEGSFSIGQTDLRREIPGGISCFLSYHEPDQA